jgi:hypothetical protein
MKIYHGTHFNKLDLILKEGIKSRGTRGKTNWKNAPSHPNLVYLSTAYPFYFSQTTLTKNMNKGLVFEIDMDRLDKKLLFPDEDFIWYVLKKKDPDLKLEFVRKNLFAYRDNWTLSLEHMGNCAYLGKVDLDSITRYCIIDFDIQKEIGWSVLDPSITVMNYQFKGQYYKDLVSWIFGDKKKLPQLKEAKELVSIASNDQKIVEDCKKRIDFWTKAGKNRKGIEVVEL